jgi:hypothetical protein
MNRKCRGELSELAFIYKATGLGFHVSKPYGDSSPYDFIVEHFGHLSKVQVKSTATVRRSGAYEGNAQRSTTQSSRRYSARDVDFFAFYVIPKDVWYIVPFADVEARCSIVLNPNRPSRDRRFGRYREAWHMLQGFTDSTDLRFTLNIDASEEILSS